MAFGLVGIGAGLRRGLLTSLRTIYVLSQKPWLPRPARSMLLSVVAVALILRCTRLATAKHAAIAAAIVATATASGIPFTATLATCFAVVCILVHIHPEDGLGHRVGAKGFDGERVENSLEALRHLAARDAAGDFAFSHFPFIEFDVQETKDGQLVLFHDAQLGRAIPDTGPNVTALQALRNQGIDVETVTVQELTAAQLATLHLGGNPGVYVPTLKQFLE